ncbi:MAG TPA: efflux RND transporter periplasmic adaptor subunit [Kofleriaceae bacterium]|nr:efflux RND transporter periplasmic adaptor subunit [Kofleriaceae bacterium]
MSKTASRRPWAALAAMVVVATAIADRGGLTEWFLGHAGDTHGQAVGGGDVAYYTCSMDPSVEAHEPGKCPLCGMDLTPVSRDERDSDAVRIGADSMQRIGVRFAAARKSTLRQRIVALGEVVEAGATPATPGASAWADALLYEADASAVREGQAVRVRFPALPIDRFDGSIALVTPDPDAKTTRIRVAIQDPGLVLQPGMHAEAEIEIDLVDRLVVPARAVIHAGERRLAFVQSGPGRLEPRQLVVGAQAGGFVEVKKGLAEGDSVVVAGTFLVAAESRIRSRSKLWTEEAPARAPVPAARPQEQRPQEQRPQEQRPQEQRPQEQRSKGARRDRRE